MEKIENNGQKIICQSEREYSYLIADERDLFIDFMHRLGFKCSGVYVSDAGHTIVMY